MIPIRLSVRLQSHSAMTPLFDASRPLDQAPLNLTTGHTLRRQKKTQPTTIAPERYTPGQRRPTRCACVRQRALGYNRGDRRASLQLNA
ncbi:conserved hypothetical protein [Xanthomonas citri pv. bilvae]|nr:conserved hypothetical protein [Xanthomonas citri pv. bilvae]